VRFNDGRVVGWNADGVAGSGAGNSQAGNENSNGLHDDWFVVEVLQGMSV